MYSYGLIALAIARAITGHTRTSKSTDYCPNCTQKCVINYTNSIVTHWPQLIDSYVLEKCPICVPNLLLQPMASESASGQQSPLKRQEALHEQRLIAPLLAPTMISHSPFPDVS